MNFALILFVLTVATGVIALADRWYLAKRRRGGIEFALKSPLPDPAKATSDVYADWEVEPR